MVAKSWNDLPQTITKLSNINIFTLKTQHQRLSLLSLREESHNGTLFLLMLPELEHYLTLRNLYLPMSFSLQLTLL